MKSIEELMEKLETWPVIGVAALFLALALPGEFSSVPALQPFAPMQYAAWVTVVLCGLPMLWEAGEALLAERRITSALLITTAMVASLIIGEHFAAGEVAFIMAVGEKLEHGTVSRAHRGLQKVLSLVPTKGRRLRGTAEESVRAEELRPGDVLRVKPGETIPADGTVTVGTTTVNQATLTGESLPLDRAPGDEVFAGSINGEGSFDMCVSRAAGDSSLQRLITLMEQAGGHRAPIQKEADRWAQILVPVSLLTAVVGFGVLRFALGYEMQESLLRAVTVLVVFCPCALALATPTSIMAAIGQATHRGVMIKSGEALEALARITTVAFDKTGTLTDGKLHLSAVAAFGGETEESVLRLCAAVESRSEHPLARAIVAAAGVPLPDADDFRTRAGRGVSGVVEGRRLFCGSESYLRECGVVLTPEQASALASFRDRGMATVLLGEETRFLGIVALSDALRPESAAVLRELRGVKTVMLTGDNRRAASYQCRELPLGELRAELLPGQKAELVAALQQAGERVVMVGDGVNDAPALKAAQVGVAMSHLGSDIATEAADVSIIRDDIALLPYLLRLSRATLRTIRISISTSMLINLAAVTLGLLGLLGPIGGALVHNLGSLLVISYAALLYDRRF